MFSDEGLLQELVAVAIAAIAFLYMVQKLSGWPRLTKKRAPEPPVVIGDRLARGLEAAERRNESR
jgi:hypothetical protein